MKTSMETKKEKWSHSVVKRSGCRYTNGRLHSLHLQRFSFVGQGSSLEALPPCKHAIVRERDFSLKPPG